MTLRAVIVDDEPLARSRIVRLLERHPDIEVVGQCRNGAEAIVVLDERKPDLIFLDVQMPDMDGFAVLRELRLQPTSMVVFTTAYDRYALDAFDVHAVDYLLKPFDRERFDEAIELARGRLQDRRAAEVHQKLRDLLAFHEMGSETGSTSGLRQSFAIKTAGQTVTVPVDDVYWIAAEGNYARLNLRGGSQLCRVTLKTLDTELETSRFLRVHRSFIVNVAYVDRALYKGNGEYELILTNGDRVVSSRTYRETIGRTLGSKLRR